MGRKKKQNDLNSIEEFKKTTNQPHLSDMEALELMESIKVLTKITYCMMVNE